MTRGLRRAHLIIVSGLGLALAVTLPLVLSGIPAGKSVGRSGSDAPSDDAEDRRVIAAASWKVGQDTLFVEILAGKDSPPHPVRFGASRGARWPDAILTWWAGLPDDEGPTHEVELGIVAVGHPLTVTLPEASGSIRLFSRAWARELGRWALPVGALDGSR